MTSQLQQLLLELIPGGAKKDLSAAQAKALLAKVRPRDAAGKARRRVAAELIADLERVYAGKNAADKELKALVAETGTSLMDLHGIGPSGAARLLVEVGDITRFPNRDHFASWNGTAPIDASSGDQVRHRLSRKGNRQINRVVHIMATVQLRNATEGRAYYDRKIAEGKTGKMALRALKRQISNAVYRRLVADADRLASLGMMSAGIAHELNTPLTVLKGLVERLNRDQRVSSANAMRGTVPSHGISRRTPLNSAPRPCTSA